MRFALFDRNVSARTTVYVVGMIGAFVVAYLVLFRVFAGSLAAQAFVSAMVTLLVVAVARELGIAYAESRERAQRLTVLGPLLRADGARSPQPAHRAARRGAGARGHRRRASPTDRATRKELLDLDVRAGQAHGSAIVDRYDRMGRIEPRMTLVRVNDVGARGRASPRRSPRKRSRFGDAATPSARPIAISSRAPSRTWCATRSRPRHDRGDVRIETERQRPARLVMRVIDTGRGMDARQRERAFDDFFTTKETGSGLGLAFARRVMIAHGGDVTLASDVGSGRPSSCVFRRSRRDSEREA